MLRPETDQQHSPLALGREMVGSGRSPVISISGAAPSPSTWTTPGSATGTPRPQQQGWTPSSPPSQNYLEQDSTISAALIEQRLRAQGLRWRQ